jgi:hypothetical protein
MPTRPTATSMTMTARRSGPETVDDRTTPVCVRTVRGQYCRFPCTRMWPGTHLPDTPGSSTRRRPRREARPCRAPRPPRWSS